jgi:hypothetical protein
MLSFKQFIANMDGDVDDLKADDADDVVRTTIFGLDVAAVMLPSDMLTEDRVSRMNALWDLLGEREALVIAVSARS